MKLLKEIKFSSFDETVELHSQSILGTAISRCVIRSSCHMDWAGVGHHPYSGLPGNEGNMVLTAHNDIYGEIFRDLQLLEPGDEIRIQSENGQWYTYVVDEKQVVEPTEVWVLGQDLGGETPLATLITCHPYRVDTHRMVVFAKLVN